MDTIMARLLYLLRNDSWTVKIPIGPTFNEEKYQGTGINTPDISLGQYTPNGGNILEMVRTSSSTKYLSRHLNGFTTPPTSVFLLFSIKSCSSLLCLTSWSPLCLNAKMFKYDSTRTSCSPSKRRNSCLSALSLAASSPILYSNASNSSSISYEENSQTWSQGSLSYPNQFSIKFRFSNFAKHYDVAVINSIILYRSFNTFCIRRTLTLAKIRVRMNGIYPVTILLFTSSFPTSSIFSWWVFLRIIHPRQKDGLSHLS